MKAMRWISFIAAVGLLAAYAAPLQGPGKSRPGRSNEQGPTKSPPERNRGSEERNSPPKREERPPARSNDQGPSKAPPQRQEPPARPGNRSDERTPPPQREAPPVVVREYRFSDETLDQVKAAYIVRVPVGATLMDEWIAQRYEPGRRYGSYELLRLRPAD